MLQTLVSALAWQHASVGVGEAPLVVEEWRASLTDYDRRNLNNPIVVWRRCCAPPPDHDRIVEIAPVIVGQAGAPFLDRRALLTDADRRVLPR